MVKVQLDAGHGGKDPGAHGFGIKEKDVNLQLALSCEKHLERLYEVDVSQSRREDVFISLEGRTDQANRDNVDFFYSFHCNAGGGTGYEDYIYIGLDEDSHTAHLRNITHRTVRDEILRPENIVDRGKKQANFHVLRETVMSAVLTENLFVDTAQDAAKLKDDGFVNQLALAHAHGIAAALDLTKKNTGGGKKNNRLWIVQAGAFSKKSNAEDRVNALHEADFEAFKHKVDNLWIVQAGAFEKETNAKDREAALHKADFEAFIHRENE